MTKNIGKYAVQTVTDLMDRDSGSLMARVVLPKKWDGLAIRVCRSHWYGQHWNAVQAAFKERSGSDFKAEVGRRMQKGLFKDLILAMTEERE
jgi:hypothetical protein